MFEDLIIFEMANNHQGSSSHGNKIIKKYSELANKYKINYAIKLQYRDIESFISKHELKKRKNKHVNRFLQTSLKREVFQSFCKNIKNNFGKLIITPFDEISVENAYNDGVDIFKIASCSATDWPLLEKIASYNKPVIFSTGGQSLEDIDNLYSFFSHKNLNFALLHCVSIYPTKFDQAQLSFIKQLRNRYKDITIGYSGHEAPNDLTTASVALGCGAKIFERHIGIQTIKHKLNAYSMNIVQTEEWIKTIVNSKKLLGNKGIKKINIEEKQSIMELQRGVFLKSKISKGKKITKNDIYFAFPLQSNQISSGEFTEGLKATRDYKINEPLKENIKIKESKNIRKIIHSFKGMFSEAAVVIGDYQFIELSHHYGIKRFNKFGCILITIFNKSYCKKLVGVLPGQSHPSHRHIKKNESFHILSGELEISLNNIIYKLSEGDIIDVDRGTWHSFKSKLGCIFEEVSSKYIVGDSEYADRKINNLDPYERKTKIEQW
jgi:N-acetylneuraminate synthase